MKKTRLIDAEHLMHKIETGYVADGSWYDLVRIKTIIDSEPTVHDNERLQLIEVVLTFLTLLNIAALLVICGVIH